MTNWVEIVALVGSPVLAVALTLWRESVRQERERKLSVMRQLLLTRSNAADAAFSMAINLVPIEFGHEDAVMTAWEGFTHAADQQAATGSHVDALLKEMMLALGYKSRAAEQVARSAYIATSLGEQQRLLQGVLRGIVDIAAASKVSAKASTVMAAHITGTAIADDKGGEVESKGQ